MGRHRQPCRTRQQVRLVTRLFTGLAPPVDNWVRTCVRHIKHQMSIAQTSQFGNKSPYITFTIQTKFAWILRYQIGLFGITIKQKYPQILTNQAIYDRVFMYIGVFVYIGFTILLYDAPDFRRALCQGITKDTQNPLYNNTQYTPI